MVCKRGEDITGVGPTDIGLNNKKTIKMTRTFRIYSRKLYGTNRFKPSNGNMPIS
jgi:hypothetical protein